MEIFALYVSSITFALFFPYSRTSLCTLPCERDLVSYLLTKFKQDLLLIPKWTVCLLIDMCIAKIPVNMNICLRTLCTFISMYLYSPLIDYTPPIPSGVTVSLIASLKRNSS